jgi:hypothetical protein
MLKDEKVNTTVDANVIWCDRDELHSKAASFIRPVSTVLDIGCGIRPQQYIVPELLICIEPHLEYVEILKKSLKDANAVIIPLDAAKALAGMPDRSIDSIFLIDVIEHMEKDVGAQILLECQRVARQQIIIFTPLGFMPQEVHAGAVDGWNLHGGEWQEHKSGWYPEEFAGWDVIACKHLHLQDYLGHDIDPPYGGFYAVKNIQKVANHFNDIYSNDVLSGKTSHLSWLQENFPLLNEKVVGRDINASYLKCGIASCQRTTELFIEFGATEPQDVIFNKAAQEKSEAMLQEARKHDERIKAFAEQFTTFNESFAELDARAAEVDARGAELDARAAEVDARAAEVDARAADWDVKSNELLLKEKQVLAKEVELASKISQVAEIELEFNKRAEQIAESLSGKVYRKFRALFK